MGVRPATGSRGRLNSGWGMAVFRPSVPCRSGMGTLGVAVGSGGGGLLAEVAALAVLGLLAAVELADGAVIAHHSGPDLAALARFGGQALDAMTHGILLFGWWYCGERPQAMASARACFARRASSHFGQNSCSPAR